MKFKIKYDCWWVRDKWGGVFGYWMCFGDPKEEVPEKLYKHELQHCYQIHKKGRLRFYLSYLWELFNWGYKDNKYEVMARMRQEEPLTEQEKSWWSQDKIVLEESR